MKRQRRSESLLLTNAASVPNEIQRHSTFRLDAYNRYAQIIEHLQSITEEYPTTTELLNVTKTSEGRDFIGIKV